MSNSEGATVGHVNNDGAANDAATDGGDWRKALQPESRRKIIVKIMETLKRHLPNSGPDEPPRQLNKLAATFEEKIYSTATTQADYLKKISSKMLSMDVRSRNQTANQLQSNAEASQNSLSQIETKVQQLLVPMVSNQSQNTQNYIAASAEVRSSASSVMSYAGGVSQGTMSSGVSMPVIAHNSTGSSQRQIQIHGREDRFVKQEQHQHSQNSPQHLYNRQLQHHPVKQELQHHPVKQEVQQGNLSQSVMQQQHNLLQPYQLQSPQQAHIQPSLRQVSTASTLQSNQQSTQSVLQRQSQYVRQQQSSMPQHSMSSLQQQIQRIGQPSSMFDQRQQQQHNVISPQSISGMTQQRTISQQYPNIHRQQLTINQQHPDIHKQQLSVQQNNFSNLNQQQVQTNLSGFQMSGDQAVSACLQPMQHPDQYQQPLSQSPQKQLTSKIQSQRNPLQQHFGLQKLGNPLQRDMQPRIQASSPLLQQQTTVDQQNQLMLSQRVVPDPTTNLAIQTENAREGDWQEEAYKKIKSLKDMYYSELNGMYKMMAAKLQQLQHDALVEQPENEQFAKHKMSLRLLGRLLKFMGTSKDNIDPRYREMIPEFERQIVNVINSNRSRKLQVQAMQQKQPQVSQVHGRDFQMNSEMQPMKMHSPTVSRDQNNVASLQPKSLSSGSNSPNPHQNLIGSGLNAGSGQGHAMNQRQQVPMSFLHQNPVTTPQQMNINLISSPSGMTSLQANVCALQANQNVIESQQLIEQEPQMYSTQDGKQLYRQRQMQQQHRKPLLQQQPQPQDTQQQLPAQKMIQKQPHQSNDTNDVKMGHLMGVKPYLLQHHSAGQRASSYQQQPMKSGSPHSISSSQVEQFLLTLNEAGTPSQSANSPFIAPSPSTSLVQSPAIGDTEKVNPSMPLSSTAGIVSQVTATVSTPSQSLAMVGTSGISASPLLAEFTSTDGSHHVGSTVLSGSSSALEQPLQRLIRVVKSMSPMPVSASVNDISSVIRMVDGIAGSAPGIGSRAAVGEDLVAEIKCSFKANHSLEKDKKDGTKRTRSSSAITYNAISSIGNKKDNLKLVCGYESDGESTGTSLSIKRPKVEGKNALEEELRKINQRLIDTVLHISEDKVDLTPSDAEGGQGIIVKCSFSNVSLSPTMKLHYASALSPIQPLRLLIPDNYPICSPIILDKFHVEDSKEYEDLSSKAYSRFNVSLKSLKQPMSLGEIARVWDKCARDVVCEYAEHCGGGSFSSKYGSWENCLTAV